MARSAARGTNAVPMPREFNLHPAAVRLFKSIDADAQRRVAMTPKGRRDFIAYAERQPGTPSGTSPVVSDGSNSAAASPFACYGV